MLLAWMWWHDVSCELTGPGVDTGTFGPPDADWSIRRSAAEGPHGADALRVLRNEAA